MVSKSNTSLMKKGDRRITLRLALAAVLTAGLAACGGGGGGSDDVDLRAAYDRINRTCMTHSDVVNAVGVEPSSAPNNENRIWRSGDQRLFVTFAVVDSGVFVINGAQWVLLPANELEKGFNPNVCN